MIALKCSWAPWNWDNCVEEWLGKALSAAMSPFFKLIFKAIAKVVVDAVNAVIQAVGFLWIYIDTGDISNSGAAGFIQVHTNYILGAMASLAVIVAAIQMAVSHRGEPARDILKSLLTLVVVSGAGVGIAALLIQAGDAFSEAIIGNALGVDGNDPKKVDPVFATELAKRMTDPLKDPGDLLGFALIIFVGILMVITAIIQLALMVVRYGMLVLLIGVLPLTAAATNTEMGMMWFKRAVSWLAGFILYKPVAALIYATAIHLMSTPKLANGDPPKGTPETLNIVMGVTMMIIAVVALPAILRFVSPKTS